MKKSKSLLQEAKSQLIKGTLYWSFKYLSIFLSSFIGPSMISIIVIGTITAIFGQADRSLPIILGCTMGSFTSLTIHNRYRYQNCWLSIKLNYYRYRNIRELERMGENYFGSVLAERYIQNELKDFMEDYRL